MRRRKLYHCATTAILTFFKMSQPQPLYHLLSSFRFVASRIRTRIVTVEGEDALISESQLFAKIPNFPQIVLFLKTSQCLLFKLFDQNSRDGSRKKKKPFIFFPIVLSPFLPHCWCCLWFGAATFC